MFVIRELSAQHTASECTLAEAILVPLIIIVRTSFDLTNWSFELSLAQDKTRFHLYLNDKIGIF